jgi:soluble lytic murein transglycosylase
LRLTYPTAFRELVEEAARDRNLSPALVWAVIRQESRFKADARSPVGARGLMQIMPKTGARIAGELGASDFAPEQLADPRTNVRFGVHYLRTLHDRYDDRSALAFAAYNAGEEAVDRWIRTLGDAPTEVFIEEIPYSETRKYVKEVSKNLALYGLIYGRSD